MNTDETFILPTFENRLTSHLHSHGIDLEPGEYLVRQARYTCRMAGLDLDDDTRAAVHGANIGYARALAHMYASCCHKAENTVRS